MLKTAKILKGKSRYNVFSAWQNALQQALSETGVDAGFAATSEKILFKPEEQAVTIGFNLVRKWSLETSGQFHIAWLVDHPAYHPEIFFPETAGMPLNRDKILIASVDREWVDFAREIYACPFIYFLPHAAVTTKPVDPEATQRDMDVVFFGSIEQPEDIALKLKKISGPFYPVLEKVLSEFSYAAHCRIDRMLWNVFRQTGLDAKNTCMALNAFFPLVDRYHICKHRINTLRSIKNTEVHLFGAGPWEKTGLGDNFIIHKYVQYGETAGIMKRSRILLNHTPTLQAGGHERIFEALANGCAVLTTPSIYMHSEFGETAGLRFYRNDADSSPEILIDTLKHDKATAGLVAETQKLVMSRHHMKNRAEAICGIVEKRWPEYFTPATP